MKKEVFNKQNKTDYSLRQGAIKSAEDSGLKDLTVEECCWDDTLCDDTYSEEERTYRVEKVYDPISKTTTYKKVVR